MVIMKSKKINNLSTLYITFIDIIIKFTYK